MTPIEKIAFVVFVIAITASPSTIFQENLALLVASVTATLFVMLGSK